MKCDVFEYFVFMFGVLRRVEMVKYSTPGRKQMDQNVYEVIAEHVFPAGKPVQGKTQMGQRAPERLFFGCCRDWQRESSVRPVI